MTLLNDIEITIKSVQLERKGLDVDFFHSGNGSMSEMFAAFYHLDISLAQFYSFFVQSCRRANHIVPRSPQHNQLNHNDNFNGTASNVSWLDRSTPVLKDNLLTAKSGQNFAT